jgi:hypothetical protein
MSTLTTPRYGFPYPDGTERVMDGDNAIGALATAVESLLYPYLTGLSPIYYRATGQLVLTSAGDVIVPGMSVPGGGFVSDGPETLMLLAATDFNIVTAGVGVCSHAVFVDGVSRGGGGSFGLGPTGVGRASIMSLTMAAMNGGQHTIDVRAKKSTNAGVANVEVASVTLGNVSQSYLSIMRFKTQPTLLLEIARMIGQTLDLPGVIPAELER